MSRYLLQPVCSITQYWALGFLSMEVSIPQIFKHEPYRNRIAKYQENKMNESQY